MKRKTKNQLIFGITLLVLFILYTVSLTFVDRQPIGPQESYVAYAGINKAVHGLFSVNMTLYHITDWAGAVAIIIALQLATVGLLQWIKRKSILRVDSGILVLGVFYILVFGVYAFFEFTVINCRPVLINGVLEASYPSSTTMLAMCILPTAMMQYRRLIQKPRLRNAVNASCALFTVFMVIGRFVSGVHWFTDILGGVIFSLAMILLYCAAVGFMDLKKTCLDK